MKVLNIETPVTRHFIPQILLYKTFTSIRLATQVMTKASSDLRQSIKKLVRARRKKKTFMRGRLPSLPFRGGLANNVCICNGWQGSEVRWYFRVLFYAQRSWKVSRLWRSWLSLICLNLFHMEAERDIHSSITKFHTIFFFTNTGTFK
jgi:hypothetical protein